MSENTNASTTSASGGQPEIIASVVHASYGSDSEDESTDSQSVTVAKKSPTPIKAVAPEQDETLSLSLVDETADAERMAIEVKLEAMNDIDEVPNELPTASPKDPENKADEPKEELELAPPSSTADPESEDMLDEEPTSLNELEEEITAEVKMELDAEPVSAAMEEEPSGVVEGDEELLAKDEPAMNADDDDGREGVSSPTEQRMAGGDDSSIPQQAPLQPSPKKDVLEDFRRQFLGAMSALATSGHRLQNATDLKSNAESAVAQLNEASVRLDADLNRRYLRFAVLRPKILLQDEIKRLEKSVERKQQLLDRHKANVDNLIARMEGPSESGNDLLRAELGKADTTSPAANSQKM